MIVSFWLPPVIVFVILNYDSSVAAFLPSCPVQSSPIPESVHSDHQSMAIKYSPVELAPIE